MDSPPVYIPSEGRVVWRIRARRIVNGDLRLIVNGATIRKKIRSNGFAVDLSAAKRIAFLSVCGIRASGLFPAGHSVYRNRLPTCAHLSFALASVVRIGFDFGCGYQREQGFGPNDAALPHAGMQLCARNKDSLFSANRRHMDPGFVERHWDALPNLRALRR